MTDTTATDKDQIRKAYGTATQALREAHREEFTELMRKATANLGVAWNPRPSAEDRAKAQLEKLLAEHPNLREQVGRTPEGVVDPT